MHQLWARQQEQQSLLVQSNHRQRQKIIDKINVLRAKAEKEKEEDDARMQLSKLSFPRTIEAFEELFKTEQQDALLVAKYLVAEDSMKQMIWIQAYQAGKAWQESDVAELLRVSVEHVSEKPAKTRCM